MSEYIVKCTEVFSVIGNSIEIPNYIDLSSEIVRCRDCANIRAWSPDETIDYDGQPIEDIEDAFCTFMRIGTEYDYFCSWAKRKDADSVPSGGTCMNDWAEFGKFKCSECGLQIGSISTCTTAPIPIAFCPRCGAKVVE